MKRIIIALVVALISMQAVFYTFAAERMQTKADQSKGVYNNSLRYKTENDEVTITGYVSAPTGKLEIPEEIDGYPVTKIGSYAFIQTPALTSVSMPSVRSVGEQAFSYCKDLAGVSVPKLERVEGTSFFNTAWYNNLTDEFAVFGDGVLVKYCGKDADVTIPENVKWVSGFYDNDSIKSVTVKGVHSIGDTAFFSCDSLKTVSVPNVFSVGAYAFSECESLESVEMSNVRSIEDGAFSNCTSLKSAEMPSVNTIGANAFLSCKSLTNVSLPSASSIGDWAFSDCSSVVSVDIPNISSAAGTSFCGTSWYQSLTDEFAVFGNGVLIKYCGKDTKVTVPDNVKCVAGFYNSKITSVNMPYAESIGESAFCTCYYLESVSMPKVQSISSSAFMYCFALKKADMPSTISVGKNAFNGCSSLLGADMPKVTTIGNNAFCFCTSLESANMPKISVIEDCAFSGCISLENVDIYNALTIGDGAFRYCELLLSAYFYSDAPEYFGEEVFDECTDGFTIYFARGKKGWTSPVWNGYRTQEFNPDAAPEFGDVNGDGRLNTADAVIVLKFSAGMTALNETQKAAADCNDDGKINTGDAVIILKYAAGMLP